MILYQPAIFGHSPNNFLCRNITHQITCHCFFFPLSQSLPSHFRVLLFLCTQMQSILQIFHAACSLIRSKRSLEVGVILPSLSVLVEDNEAGENSCQSHSLHTSSLNSLTVLSIICCHHQLMALMRNSYLWPTKSIKVTCNFNLLKLILVTATDYCGAMCPIKTYNNV